MFKQLRKTISIVISVVFIITSIKSPAYAQLAQDQMPHLPAPGMMVHLSPQFIPAYLQGITIHPDNALRFDFLIYKGDKILAGDQKKEEYKKLVKYFLASLTIPDEDQWVNLSPYEKDRIIKDDFGKTEMGRDLLAQDYMLKQITSSLIYPEDGLGKKFWNEVYERAWSKYHTTDVPMNTFNKVWIVPDQAVVYESGNSAYILKSHLKVMLEEDYLSLEKHSAISSTTTHSIGSHVIREIILPALEKEVNEGKNFANLRQMYSGMVLATWYKKALKESLLGRVYADKAKVKGIDQDPKTNGEIYERYLKAFKKGVFNYIKEDVNKYTNEAVPRKYFSGGFKKSVSGHGDLALIVLRKGIPIPKGINLATLTGGTDGIDQATISLEPNQDKAMFFDGIDWDLKFFYARQYIESNDWEGAKQILDRATREIPKYRIFLRRRLEELKIFYRQSSGDPRRKPDLDLVNKAMASSTENANKPTVLIVENNPTYAADLGVIWQEAVDQKFGKDKTEVLVASTTERANEILKYQRNTALVVVDTQHLRDWVDLSIQQRLIQSPVIDSIGRRIKQSEQVTGIWNKTIGKTEETYLQKPYGFIEILDVIEEVASYVKKRIDAYEKEAMADTAMRASKPSGRDGGIDFNSANLNLRIKRDGKGVPLPLVQQDMAQLSNIQGFEAEVIDIRPAINVSIMSELQQKLQPNYK